MAPLFYTDLHCHSSMKPFHSGKDGDQKSLWEYFEKSQECHPKNIIDKNVDGMIKYSQVDFSQAYSANIFLLFNALYPIELPWFALAGIGNVLIRSKEHRLWLATCLTNFNQEILIEKFLNVKDGIPLAGDPDSLKINYFSRLVHEFGYVRNQTLDPVNRCRILCDFNDYRSWKSKLQTTTGLKEMAIIMCIEGAHSFHDFDDFQSMLAFTYEKVKDDRWQEFDNFRNKMLSRIDEVKRWGPDMDHPGLYAPLYITFSHHFWNLLAGHSTSMSACFMNQSEGLGQPFTALGLIALEKLLERGPSSRRILIDIKHLSYPARTGFFKVHRKHEADQDNFPIIASHAAVTGFKNPEDEGRGLPFNSGDINLYDDDILEIKRSEGLIGLMMEETRLLDENILMIINEHFKDDPAAYSVILAHAVMGQILHIVNLSDDLTGWNIICLGSDFDGMINSLDSFDTALKIPELYTHLHNILEHNLEVLPLDYSKNPTDPEDIRILFTSEDVRRLKGDLTADEIIDKLSYKNVERFLEKFFNEEYLKNTTGNTLIAGG